MATKLCETVTGRTMAELVRARDGVSAADLVELRLDGIDDVDVAAALAGRSRPVVVTCRPSWEGGRFAGSEEERETLLRRALDLGAEYVDIEWRAGFDQLVREHRAKVLLSAHDFVGVPPDIVTQAEAMRRGGAAMIKVAVTARRLTDLLPLLDISRQGPAVVIGMGEAGVPSRLLAARFGSLWSYGGHAVAPGQIPVRRMQEEFRFGEIDRETPIYGVVGINATHSVSPVMHNAAFRAGGIDAVYVPLQAADFDDFVRFAHVLQVRGASVTIPYKLDALQAALATDDKTRAVGAANTLRRRDDGWEATNTDVDGFLEPLLERYPGSLRGARAAVLGGGGAARAVVIALESCGAIVTVYARRDAQARALAESFGVGRAAWPPAPDSWDLLVNCTPLGSASARDESPLPGGPFDGQFVYDLTYRASGEAPLIRDARRAGCVTVDGLPMLIAQAERQFEWWMGQRPARGVMANAAGRLLPAPSDAAPLNQLQQRETERATDNV